MIKRKNGFTIAELLIVVAIIGVLVTVAIPVFNGQLEKSRESTDLANVRSAYAELIAAINLDDIKVDSGSLLMYRSDENGKAVYGVNIPLKQKKNDWQRGKEGLELGGVKSSDSLHWIGEPKKNGHCTIEVTDGQLTIIWSGLYHDYFATLADAVYNNKNHGYKNNNSSNVLNSTYGSANSTFKNIIDALKDAGLDDVKTWAAVRDPKDKTNDGKTNAQNYNYLISTFSITDNSLRSQKVPVMYIDKGGNYSVGYATVKKAPDGNYNVITVGQDGTYAAPGEKNNYNENFESSGLVSDAVSYSNNRYAAEAAYRKLAEEYSKKN